MKTAVLFRTRAIGDYGRTDWEEIIENGHMGVMEKWETLISNKTLAPSLLAADFTRLGEEAGIVERAGVEILDYFS